MWYAARHFFFCDVPCAAGQLIYIKTVVPLRRQNNRGSDEFIRPGT
jgi:hypothetical protein